MYEISVWKNLKKSRKNTIKYVGENAGFCQTLYLLLTLFYDNIYIDKTIYVLQNIKNEKNYSDYHRVFPEL